jgi:hypothetical protein
MDSQDYYMQPPKQEADLDDDSEDWEEGVGFIFEQEMRLDEQGHTLDYLEWQLKQLDNTARGLRTSICDLQERMKSQRKRIEGYRRDFAEWRQQNGEIRRD